MSVARPGKRLLSADRWDDIAWWAIVAGAVIRVVWVLWLHPPLAYLSSDMGGYVERAMRVASGVAPAPYDAFYPPGTHLLLALPLFLFGADRAGLWAGAVLWCALSVFTPFAMWRFARHHLTVPAAALTAAFVALWPILISYAGYFTSETPALALLVASLWLADRAASRGRVAGLLGAGLLAGAAVANRPALVLNAVIAALATPPRVRLLAVAAIGAGGAVLLALVVAYNTAATGHLAFVSQNGGITFYLGHCDVRRVTARDGTFLTPPTQQRGTGSDATFPDRSVGDQSFFYQQGLACIRDDGLAHARILARDVLDLTLTTSLWPQVGDPAQRPFLDLVNVLFSAALPFILVGSVRLIRARRRQGERAGESVMLAHFLTVLATALVFFGDPRFRAPYDVFALALAAALVADRWFDREKWNLAELPSVHSVSWHAGSHSRD